MQLLYHKIFVSAELCFILDLVDIVVDVIFSRFTFQEKTDEVFHNLLILILVEKFGILQDLCLSRHDERFVTSVTLTTKKCVTEGPK